MKQKKIRKWFCACFCTVLAGIAVVGLLVYVFDPYFHFHKPFPFVRYRLYDERYTNDGISRNFDYDTIITGTSMAQNFKPSELDELYGLHSVKETFSGSGFQEQSQNLQRALERNEDLSTIFWSLDYNCLIREKDWTQYENYPTYLYDDNPWNDVSYVFNKSVLYHGVLTNMMMTLTGQDSTTMDEYSSWDKPTGHAYIMASYLRWKEKAPMREGLTEEERTMVRESVQENIVDLVKQYPDTTFYLFYTPYSIYYWDYQNQEGLMQCQFEAEQLATELLLTCENVKLYNFFNHYDIVCNADNYRDKEHYSPEINSKILEWMTTDEDRLTKDNYLQRLEEEKAFYLNYDYESLFTK